MAKSYYNNRYILLNNNYFDEINFVYSNRTIQAIIYIPVYIFMMFVKFNIK